MILKFLGLIYLGLTIYCNFFFIKEVRKQSLKQGKGIDMFKLFINILFLPIVICIRACKGDE
jgi:hypothetical protein